MLGLLIGGCCHPKSNVLEPTIEMVPQQRNVDCLPTAFPKLTPLELKEDWGKNFKLLKFLQKNSIYIAPLPGLNALSFSFQEK